MAVSRALAVVLLMLMATPAYTGEIVIKSIVWQQVDADASYTLAPERRVYTQLDRAARFILAVQTGRGQPAPSGMSAAWSLARDRKTILAGEASLASGMACVEFDLSTLTPGGYELTAVFRDDGETFATRAAAIDLRHAKPKPTTGRIAIVLPSGVEAGDGVAPLTFGLPFPKGTLRDASRIRIIDGAGQPVASQTTVRSRWGFAPDADVRWLGVDIQSPSVEPYWPDRKAVAYTLEFGEDVTPAPIASPLIVTPTPDGFFIDTGVMQCTMRRGRFNLVDHVVIDGQTVITPGQNHGPYLVDHEGSIYRAVNDREATLTIEEQGPLRTVFRAEGWYIKDNTDGSRHDFRLPTDRLCKFISRVEVYAGQPTMRLMHTWVITYDSFNVRLRDVGIAIPAPKMTQAMFGVDEAARIETDIPPAGVRLVQHRPDRFDVESDGDPDIGFGAHSDGEIIVAGASHLVSVCLRDVWQRFPKEFEALPNELRIHLWPAHGRDHPDIDPLAKDRYHQLWFAHQGRDMNLAVPWETLFTAMRLRDNPSTGIYAPGGTVIGGIHASAMGAAITSDLLIQFRAPDQADVAHAAARSFQARPHALADPAWLAKTEAMGQVHPYDPEHFPALERAADELLHKSWELQDRTGEYGMFLYRLWHHGTFNADGYWDPYRIYSAGHHYESYLPWLFYARSGDPSILINALATSRQLSDLGVKHYDDPRYEHREYNSRTGRMVGSVGHTNGFVIWGGDHTLLGHPTSFNGLITAYYLTGDLRLREVVVDEWQHTLLEDRANRAIRSFIRNGIGRDNNNALGELIDLYQLTYDPRLLAYIEPRLELHAANMASWGMSLQKVIDFVGDPRVTSQLIDSVEARVRGEKDDPYKLFYVRCAAGVMAEASRLDPSQGYAMRAMLMADAPFLQKGADTMFEPGRNSFTYCVIPDYLLHYPAVMAATARERSAVGGRLPSRIDAQPFPAANSGYSRVVVREQSDAPFDIVLPGMIGDPGVAMQVFNPQGLCIINQRVGPGSHVNVRVPSDDIVGEYVIFVKLRDGPDGIVAPITSLPGEVYVVAQWNQVQPTRFFTAVANMPDGRVAVMPHVTPGSLVSAEDLRELATTQDGQLLAAPLGAKGMWITMRGRYANALDRRPLVLAVNADRFFKPSQTSLNITPIENE